MKRKANPKAEPVVPAEILEKARSAAFPDRFNKPGKCSVCASPTASATEEPLCWVCLRLKISAWREGDQQMPAQE